MLLEFVYREANELVNSFYTFTCKTIFRRSEREKNWKAEIERGLPEEFRRALAQDDSISKKLGLVHVLVTACPVDDSKGFIDWFRERTAGEIYEILSPYKNQFPEELGSLRDKLVYFLESWYEAYFRHLDPNLFVQLEQEAVRRNRELTAVSDLNAYVEEVTNGLVFEPQEHLQKIIFTPQFHGRPLNWIFPFDSLTWCHYAFDASHQSDEEEPSSELREAAKALSDVNRLKILRYLRQGPRSYIEVVKQIGLAKSTVYEHMLVLRSAGLVRSNIIGESASSYSLRREGIDKLNKELEKWLEL